MGDESLVINTLEIGGHGLLGPLFGVHPLEATLVLGRSDPTVGAPLRP